MHNIREKILDWVIFRPFADTETQYFDNVKNDTAIFFPLGRPGIAFVLTKNQKRRFLHIQTALIITFFIGMALCIQGEMQKIISIFALVVLAFNVYPMVYFAYPIIYAKSMNAEVYDRHKSKNKKPYIVGELQRLLISQYVLIILGLAFNIYNYYLWILGAIVTIVYPATIYILRKKLPSCE